MAYKAERPWEREGAHSSGWGGDSRGNADREKGEIWEICQGQCETSWM